MTVDYSKQYLPTDDEFKRNVKRRQFKAKVWRGIFFSSILVAMLALVVLIGNTLDQSFGYVAVVSTIDIEAEYGVPLADMTKEEMANVLAVSDATRANQLRTALFERVLGAPQDEWALLNQQAVKDVVDEYPDDLRDVIIKDLDKVGYAIILQENLSTADLETTVVELVVQPDIQRTWKLWESMTKRGEIEAIVEKDFPDAKLQFRNWLTLDFLTQARNSKPEITGIRTAIVGTSMIIFFTILMAFPIGVGAAIYLEEYARKELLINRIIQVNINNLAGVPSIIYGMLGLAIFVRMLESLTQGRTIISAAATMAILVLPIIIINGQEAVRAVPNSIRQASYGLGATKWQTIWNHVLPSAMPGILTGTILAVSRAIGETAPLIVVGAAVSVSKDPTGPFSAFTALPLQIFNWVGLPQEEFQFTAAAAIVVLLAMLLTLNSVAIILRNRFSRRVS